MKPGLILVFASLAWADDRCLLVDQSSVTAGDLARALPQFHSVDAGRHLVWAPAPGLTRTLKAGELQRLAAREGVTAEIGVGVCLQRKTIVFSEEQVLGALRKLLPAGADVQLVDYCKLPMMTGQLRFQARPAGAPMGESRRLLWKGVVIDGDRRTAPFWASVQLRMERRVIRAARLIRANAILTSEDLTEAVEQSATVDSGPAPELSALVGKEAARTIEAKEQINPSWLRTPPLVRKGETVRVTVESGHALLALDAHALSAGNKGDTLVVRNGESGKSFKAQVTGPGRAVVRMESQHK